MFSFRWLYYSVPRPAYNKQKRLRDKSLITEPQSVKIIIRFVKMIKSELETGERCRHGAFDEPGKSVHDLLRVLPHIVFDPVEHQPDKNV